MTQTPPEPAPPAQTPPARKTSRLVLIVGVLIVLLLLLIIGTCDNSPDADEPAASPAAAPSSAPAEQPTPTPQPSEAPQSEDTDPDSDTILTYLAESAGAATPDEACIDGISWLCAIDYVNARGGVLEVRVDNTENAEGDAIARSFYNFLTASDDSPMPDVFFVQVTTAADGEVGGFRNY